MRIRDSLIDILCNVNPLYEEYVVREGTQDILYVHVTKAM
jgi:hypothetical protein